MSVPLPFPTNKGHSPLDIEQYLTAEDRYDVYVVKAAERPHFLLLSNNENPDGDNNDEPEIIDGCDIQAWRKHGLGLKCNDDDDLFATVCLGSGNASVMLKRSSQWPLRKCFRGSTKSSKWNELKDRMMNSPSKERAAIVVDYKECIASFKDTFEDGNMPAKILNAMTDWKAFSNGRKNDDNSNDTIKSGWTFDDFLSRFGNINWRFSDQHGEMMSLECYAKYIFSEGEFDDSPLAIYDSEFGDDDSPTNQLLNEYNVPSCFSEDLFSLAADDDDNTAASVPPFRWILIGPERSGTGLHIDPLFTNAWVALLQGTKFWMLFPPETPPSEIGMDDRKPQIPSSIWFATYFDKVKGEKWPMAWRPVEVLQRRGEVVFVPAGWAHLVINLSLTVAVTHNYACEHGPFERMWQQVVEDEPSFANRWYQGLKQKRPDLALRALSWHNKPNNRHWSDTVDIS